MALRVVAALGPTAAGSETPLPALWRALDALDAAGCIERVRVQPAQEAELRRQLGAGPAPVLHLVAQTASRAAGYATLALAGSNGLPRSVALAALGPALRQAGVRLAVVAPLAAPGANELQRLAEALLEQGLRCVVATAAEAGGIERFYRRLAEGGSAGEAAAAANQAAPERPWIVRGDAQLVLQPVTTAERPEAAPAASRAAAQAPPAAAAPSPAPDPAAEALRAKRAAGRFDVFLCHNSADKPAVRRIGERLKASGILPWLDEWELPPGQPWQPLLEQQIERIGSAAVFFGGAGVGPWHQQEMRGFIEEVVSRQVPLIPVILADAPELPKLPLFMRGLTWVDFRRAEPDPFERLLWGVTQRRRDDA